MKSVQRILITVMTLVVSFGVFITPAFSETLKELAAQTDGSVVKGKNGWLFLKEEIEHMAAGQFWGEKAKEVSKTAKKEFADPVPAIVDFNNQLNELGVQLLFVPIPPKALIYGENLPGDFAEELKKVQTTYDSFYEILSGQGVQVVDMRQRFMSGKSDGQLYCKTDTHYSGVGLDLVADVLAEEIASASWYEAAVKKVYQVEEKLVAIKGDLAVMAGMDSNEQLTLSFVAGSGTGALLKTDPSSPVLVLGDSHTLVFSAGGEMHARGAGLADNVAAKTEIPYDLLGVRGSGATPARIKLYQKNRRNTDYIGNKKIVIWCLTAREFTGAGGWRKVPVVPGKK